MKKEQLRKLLEVLRNAFELFNSLFEEVLNDQSLEVYDYEMETYSDEVKCDFDPKVVTILEIKVQTEKDKIELLKCLQYLHDNPLIDTDYCAVNTLVHFYLAPELIKVVGD